MRIQRIIVGELEENCYVLFDDIKKTCLIVDPGDEADKILEKIEGYELLAILVTHTHDDHIGAIPDITNKYKVPIYDKENLSEGEKTIGTFIFDVIYTPGHKEDQIVFYFKHGAMMFVGDFIFKGSIGRIDLPGGDPDKMKESIGIILTYPKDITIFPGHGEITTLQDEERLLKYYYSII